MGATRSKVGGLGLALGLALAACTSSTLDSLDGEYDSALRSGKSDKLISVALKAKAAAERTAAPQEAVGLWRIAALSEWQSGSAAAGDLEVVSAAGIAACE